MHYFEQVPLITNFKDALDPANQTKVPKDWYLFLADVQNSTLALEKGQYRNVNLVGASCLMAVTNAVGKNQVAAIFGGDGATFLVPPQWKELVADALRGCRKMAQQNFGLNLRVGMIPVDHLTANGYDLRMGRVALSPFFTQAVISGSGLAAAESLIKDTGRGWRYHLDNRGTCLSNFAGLECRWEPIENTKGQILSLIVLCQIPNRDQARRCYQEILSRIETILHSGHPISREKLRLSFRPSRYQLESSITGFLLPKWKRSFSALGNFFLTQVFRVWWSLFGRKAGAKYQDEILVNSDVPKFDGVLRMILDAGEAEKQELEKFLDKKVQSGEISYGLHSARHALMTCLILNRQTGEHLHLIDGAEGGYSEAARQLKARMKTRTMAGERAS